MSGQIVLPDSSGVNLDNTVQRRHWMEKAFRALGLWDPSKKRLKWEGHEESVEEKLCERLDNMGWHNVSHPHFERAYDEGLWRTAVKRGNLTLAQVPWPWEGHPYPPVEDLTHGVSLVYKAWRDRHGKSTEEPQGRGAQAHNFGTPFEETKGNVSAFKANTPQPLAGQATISQSSVGHALPAPAQAQSLSVANMAPLTPAIKQEVKQEDHTMTGSIDRSIPSWPLPGTRNVGLQWKQEPSDAGYGIDGGSSSGRDLAGPGLPSPRHDARAIERLERENQELRENNARLSQELRENDSTI